MKDTLDVRAIVAKFKHKRWDDFCVHAKPEDVVDSGAFFMLIVNGEDEL